jgi:diguanylate cyclase (GGDEF)-like protein
VDSVKQTFIGRVLVPTAATVLLLTLIVFAALSFSTVRADEIAGARQSRLFKLVLQQTTAEISNDQEASTVWDDAVLQVRKKPLDMAWLDANLGIWFHTYYHHDENYILNPANSPVYAARAGVREDARAFGPVSTETLKLAASLRHRLLREGEAAKSGIGETVMIGERPAYISVKPIISESGKIKQVPGSEYLHVSVRYLDRSYLADLSRKYWFNDAHFQHSRPNDDAFTSIPLMSSSGSTLGYVAWRPFRPGTRIAASMTPILAGSLALFALLSIWLILRIRRETLQLQASEAQSHHLAFHDVLTGLPNRALFNDRLEMALSRARRGHKMALLLLDLDRFKHVNDTLGHLAGDELIREVAHRLTRLIREQDTVARLGGDEFGILLTDIRSDENVRTLCLRILEAVRDPFEIAGSLAHVGVSIGVVHAPAAGTERVDLLRKADIALYRVKDEGRFDYRFFSEDMDEQVKLRGAIEGDLRSALASGTGLQVHYQPQIAGNGSRDIIGLEALIRWKHPTRGLMTPDQFIGVAEESGLIRELGEWVLRQACKTSARWPHLNIAVNVSPIQFRGTGFANRVIEIVNECGAKPSNIQLEITESVLIDEDETVILSLRKLRAAGVKIALDDFGTGYSALRHLRRFEVDKIKIDQSFVQHLGQTEDSAAIVSAVVTLGHAMGLVVTAEGVETIDQQTFLRTLGCNEMQGHLYSPAVSENELPKLLDAFSSGRFAA